MPILFLLIIGAAAGFLATRFMRVEMSMLATIMVGVAGALIGGMVIRLLLAATGAVAGLVGAVLGAMVVIWVVQRLRS
ncbi:MAG: GlsB/YeaQ/YmgE family stress response membrane protein [Marivita sp.]|uniref:GlsB/YeaQ/YmgE family stress response membrane protein n=1 Tax=Marivita sp. TaxID=2003365 RepID=UPI0025BA7F0F|nr:GlsB/YeaQ/YmgE family stress response membrane protein [Marivita sp.]MCI5110686.1 GlsB/YeaQ/YmgE family stress response membrane protein [Marivita sp.]